MEHAPENHSGREWLIVIEFFAFGGLLVVVLSGFVSSKTLAQESGFLVAVLALYIAVKLLTSADTSFVGDLIAATAFLLTEILLSLLMRRSLAIGLAVVPFVIVRKLAQQFGDKELHGKAPNRIEALIQTLLQALLFGALAFVLCELFMRIWTMWQNQITR